MASSYQNRLVGTIVIVALAVIFLPEILSGKDEGVEQAFQKIPAKPLVQLQAQSPSFPNNDYQNVIDSQAKPVVVEVPADEAYEQAHADVSTDVAIANDAITDNTAETAEPVNTDKPIIIDVKQANTDKAVQDTRYQRPAWVIQLGSFKIKKNVDSLVAKLKREGYLVFTKPIKTETGELTKVFIGPDLDKAKLDAMIPDVNKLTKLSGKLAVYNPTQ